MNDAVERARNALAWLEDPPPKFIARMTWFPKEYRWIKRIASSGRFGATDSDVRRIARIENVQPGLFAQDYPRPVPRKGSAK